MVLKNQITGPRELILLNKNKPFALKSPLRQNLFVRGGMPKSIFHNIAKETPVCLANFFNHDIKEELAVDNMLYQA